MLGTPHAVSSAHVLAPLRDTARSLAAHTSHIAGVKSITRAGRFNSRYAFRTPSACDRPERCKICHPCIGIWASVGGNASLIVAAPWLAPVIVSVFSRG